MSDALPDNRLWAIACYFNPFASPRRLANYRAFRRRLAVPLVTVELAYRPDFDLGDGDAERLIQLRGEDILWQKERLLNLALAHLPDACTAVLWTDTDIVFGSHDWPERVVRQLDRFPLVHAFDRIWMLPAHATQGEPSAADAVAARESVIAAIDSGLSVDRWMQQVGRPGNEKLGVGYAWAARRECLDRHGFFDACIVGGGDRAMVCAAYGAFDLLVVRHRMNERQRRRYLEWARPLHETVAGRVASVAGDAFHLWHGEIEKRLYDQRHADLAGLGFDPFEDIAIAENGAWRWSSNKPDLHRCLRDYFVFRDQAERELVE